MRTPSIALVLIACLLSSTALAVTNVQEMARAYFKAPSQASAAALAEVLVGKPGQGSYDERISLVVQYYNNEGAYYGDAESSLKLLAQETAKKRNDYNALVEEARSSAAWKRRGKVFVLGAAVGAVLSQFRLFSPVFVETDLSEDFLLQNGLRYAVDTDTGIFYVQTLDQFPASTLPLATFSSPVSRGLWQLSIDLNPARGVVGAALVGGLFVLGSNHEIIGFRSLPEGGKTAAEKVQLLNTKTALDRK